MSTRHLLRQLRVDSLGFVFTIVFVACVFDFQTLFTQEAGNQELSVRTVRKETEQKIADLKKQLSEAEKEKGQDHADLIPILTDISKAYREEGGHIPALPFAQRALEISKKVHGQDSLDTISTLDFVGTLYRAQGDNPKALEYYQKALPIVQKNLGTDHPAYAALLHNMALVYNATDDIEKALEKLQQAAEIIYKTFGPASHELTGFQLSLGKLFLKVGNYSEAEQMLVYALTIRSEALTFESREDALLYMAPIQNLLGALYTVTVLYDKAEPMLLDALSAYEANLSADHPSLEEVLVNLAALYEAMGQADKAAEYQKRAEHIHEQNLEFAHISTSPMPKPIELPDARKKTPSIFANSRVGDSVVYESPGSGIMEKREIVRLTPVVVVVKTSRKFDQNDEWGGGLETLFNLNADLSERWGVSKKPMKAENFSFGEKDITCEVIVASEDGVEIKLYVAPDIVPVGGLVKLEQAGNVLLRLIDYQLGE